MPVPIELKQLRVTSLDVDFHEVSWTIAPTTFDILDYQFQVLRSEAVEGPFEALAPPFEDRYTFIDNVLQVANRWRQYNYKIRVIEKVSGDTKEFGPVAHDPDPDIVATELRRHIRILMREFAGRRCIVLPRRTFGQRCPECWHPVLNKRMKSGCVTCYDTGFNRGYLYPIEAFVQIDPSSKSNQHNNTGSTQQDNTTCRLGYYPPVKPGDLIIEAENVRWRVGGQTQTEHSRAAVHQEMQLHRIPEKDIEYSIPVHFGQELKNLYITPARNFTNPHNLANFESEEIPGIFALYPSTYPRQS
jgi:hypothetical protein